MSPAKKMISLKSSDGETFEVKHSVAIESQTLKHLIEDNCADKIVTLPNVTSKTLAKVIEYCKRHVDAAESKKADDGVSEYFINGELRAFDAEFVKVDQETLFDLIMASHNLKIKSLKDLTCQTVAEMIKANTPVDVRRKRKRKFVGRR